MYVCMYVYVTFWAPRGAHAQRANVTGSIKGLKVTVNCISVFSAMLLLMKSLGLLIAALVRYVPTTALCVVNALHALGPLRASKRCTRIILRVCVYWSNICFDISTVSLREAFHCVYVSLVNCIGSYKWIAGITVLHYTMNFRGYCSIRG